VHVQHWIRLSRDLVYAAALHGIPAIVTLHDYWTTCLVAFRIRPAGKQFCHAPLAPDPCLECAQAVPPRTPWVSRDAGTEALAGHRSDLIRELRLARSVVVPCASHGAAVARYLGLSDSDLSLRVVKPGRELALTKREPLAPGPKLVLGCWGHLHPIKGQDLIIEAMHRMKYPERVQLQLAGGEPDAEFAQLLRERMQGLDVRLHAAYQAEDLDSHAVSRVHAMVSGTRADESWGLVIDEACALGLPMILPRSGAFPERLEEGRGALFYAARDAASLAELLDQIVLQPELLSKARAAMPALSEVVPGVEQQVERLLELYREAIEAGAPEVAEHASGSGPERAARQAAWDTALGAAPAEDPQA